MFLVLALQEFGGEGGGGGGVIAGVIGLIYLAVLVLMVASMWKIFDKAGQLGWAALIPIYNVIVLLQIVGHPVWWFILMLIPFVGFIIGILVVVDLAKSFGQSVGFAPLLAFGDASYRGPAAA